MTILPGDRLGPFVALGLLFDVSEDEKGKLTMYPRQRLGSNLWICTDRRSGVSRELTEDQLAAKAAGFEWSP